MSGKSEQKRAGLYPAAVVSLIFLFLPNVLILDLLPDFVACFLLASIFRRGEDAVPYFSEAKTSALRLAYWNLWKIAGLALIVFVRSKNTSDYDILALVTTVFAAGEIVLSWSLVKNAFDALFYLGERSESSALLRGKRGDAESVRTLSYFFVVIKCLGYSVPQFFALSKVNENGTVSVVRDSYPAMLLSFYLLALAVGIAWFCRTLRYAKNVHAEGKFTEDIERLEAGLPEGELLVRQENRTLSRLFFLGTLATFFLIAVRFDTLDEIDLLPRPIHAVLLLCFALLLGRTITGEETLKKISVRLGIGYAAASLAAYITDCIYRLTYKYPETGIAEKEYLLGMANGKAGRFYRVCEILSSVELLLSAAFVISLCLLLWRFIPARLGARKTPTNDFTDDIRRLRVRTVVWTVATLLAAAVNYAAVLLEGSVHEEEILQGDGTTVSLITTRIPWFGTAAFAVTLLVCFFCAAFFRSMKEEMTDGRE